MIGNPASNNVSVLLFSANDEIEKISKNIGAKGYLQSLLIKALLKMKLKNGFEIMRPEGIYRSVLII